MRSSPGNPTVPEDATGVIFSVQPFSTEDGPGLRTTVFCKGCPLRCPWCHNPEGLSPSPHAAWTESRCTGCRECLAVCPHGALSDRGTGIWVDLSRCQACGTCVSHCPGGALEMVGRVVGAEELARELACDLPFFARSGGGITLSGGEPLLQPSFVMALSDRLHGAGIEVALDTSGFAPPATFREVAARLDLVLLDLKIMDPERHRAVCGVDPAVIHENARWLGATGKRTWVRVPLIPGYTDDEANLDAIGDFLVRALPQVERIDLLAYNPLCEADYRRLRLPYSLAGHPRLPASRGEALRDRLAALGFPLVTLSGMMDHPAAAAPPPRR